MDETEALVRVLSAVCFLAVALAWIAFECFLAQTLLRSCPEETRTLEPTRVWWMLVPVFGWFWRFQVAGALSSSFQAACAEAGVEDVGDCHRMTGFVWALSGLLSAVPLVNACAVPVSLILMPYFFIRMWELRRALRGATRAPAPTTF